MTLPTAAQSQPMVDSALATFFQAACQAFEQAANPALERIYQVGPHALRLRFANDRLVPRLTPALEHLAVLATGAPMDGGASAPDDARSALTVCIWDSTSTGVSMPPPPWPSDAYTPRGDIWSHSTGRFQIAFQSTLAGVGPLSLLDREQAVGLYWLSDARHLPDYESGAPLRNLLHWWLAGTGYQFVHAGAVGRASGGVLLVGKGGSGKSTTALACLEAGLLYLGDDYCLLSASPVPEALSLYNSAKVRPDGLLHFPQLARRVDARDRLGVEKAIFFLQRHFPERLILRFPLRAILIPRITGLPGTTLSAASPATALKALAPSTLFQLAGAGPAAFQNLARLIRQIPCYYLDAGTDLAAISGVITSLLPTE
jgi:hypothetical protein